MQGDLTQAVLRGEILTQRILAQRFQLSNTTIILINTSKQDFLCQINKLEQNQAPVHVLNYSFTKFFFFGKEHTTS